MTRRRAIGTMGGALAGLALTAAPATAAGDPWRVVEAATGKGLRWRDLTGRLAKCDAVFVGEQHDDPETHLLEARLVADLHRRVGERLVLAMEMFERDQQGALDDYLAGRIDEAALGKAITLWKNYPTDYRPMVELAREKKLAVVASNAPQKHVRQVGRQGLAALDALPAGERGQVAACVNAPAGDAYQKRFYATMEGMSSSHGGGGGDALLRRIYEAQCVRDDTMAESIERALTPGKVVVHVNGSFHSDAGLGTAARLRWRRPLGLSVAVVKAVPVKGDVAAADPAPLRGEADYLVFVPDRRPAAS